MQETESESIARAKAEAEEVHKPGEIKKFEKAWLYRRMVNAWYFKDIHFKNI